MLITLDHTVYAVKPSRDEFKRLMTCMKKAQPQEVSKHELLNHISAGKSFIGGAFTNELNSLISWQVAALDFDNETKVLDADGKPLKDEKGHDLKRPLLPGEDGFISPFEALDRCESLGVTPFAMYKTLRYSKENPRFRLLFDFSETTNDEGIARAVIVTLQELFPEADRSCKNPNRIFLGTDKTVWAICEAWFI